MFPMRIAHVTRYPNHRAHLYGVSRSTEAADRTIVPQKRNSKMLGVVIQTSTASHCRPNRREAWSTNVVQAQFMARISFLRLLPLDFLRKTAIKSNPLTRANTKVPLRIRFHATEFIVQTPKERSSCLKRDL